MSVADCCKRPEDFQESEPGSAPELKKVLSVAISVGVVSAAPEPAAEEPPTQAEATEEAYY
ncbi:GL26708 [Drosophila persimilis]|uniref:GL26708 n=1 Tax=Drosophila persimilis TaxID=7234 RepID=B4GSB3_DROPE|nr:GL26708 [Drosophila persimilis]